MRAFVLLLTSFFCLCPPALLAQDNQATLFSSAEPFPLIHELNWLNEQFLMKQRVRVEEITRKHFGKPLEQGEANLPLLQRIVAEQLIPADATEDLQALGVVLGDAYVARHKSLSWKVFEDDLGKSHAVCISGTKHCLFPITMLSRRISAGAPADVPTVYAKGWQSIEAHLPRQAYREGFSKDAEE